MKPMDWSRGDQGYDEDQDRDKRAYHREARKRLQTLADDLGLARGAYDLRTNLAGPASRGETTLHGEEIYVQVGGLMNNVMIRTCRGRRDYCGGPNNFADIRTLDDRDAIAARVRSVMGTRLAA